MPEYICDSAGKSCANCPHGVPHEKKFSDNIEKNWCSDVKMRCFAYNKRVRCIPYKEVKPYETPMEYHPTAWMPLPQPPKQKP